MAMAMDSQRNFWKGFLVFESKNLLNKEINLCEMGGQLRLFLRYCNTMRCRRACTSFNIHLDHASALCLATTRESRLLFRQRTWPYGCCNRTLSLSPLASTTSDSISSTTFQRSWLRTSNHPGSIHRLPWIKYSLSHTLASAIGLYLQRDKIHLISKAATCRTL